jgi:nitrite reductase/ring-hydroxylating ferredoxin subunit
VTERISRRNALTGAALLGIGLPTLAACGAGGDNNGPLSDTAASNTDAAASTTDVPVGGGTVFGAPLDIVVTQPTKGEFVGFVNVCTHQGCPMRDVTSTINCSCHGSQFSITDGTNVAGPNGSPAGSINPLPTVQLKITGTKIALA